jgi:Dolichyl-phosphate-mannose-protein mannosyltransferase
METESRTLRAEPPTMPATSPSRVPDSRVGDPARWWLTALVLLLGCALRIVPWTSFDGLGYDESFYRKYVHALDRHGLAAYPDICAAYLADGADAETAAKVPPTRALFVVAAWAWKRAAFGDAPPADLDTPEGLAADPARIALHRVATLFGCLALFAAWGFAQRLFGGGVALAALALFACSPLLIHMSQHPLVDGLHAACALLALWTLWESMQPEARSVWLLGYALSFGCMVLVKENAFFSAIGLGVLMLVGKRTGIGLADRRHWFAAIAGGLLAVAVLTTLAGDVPTLCAIYGLLVGKAQALDYAQTTGDGAWSRYLVDLMIFTPATLCFAIGGALHSAREGRRGLPLLLFIAATYLVMCNVRYGMNLRYTTIWVFPLCTLAAIQAALVATRFRRPSLVLAAIIGTLCLIDLAQYRQFFVKHRLYELPTADLLRAERMLK